MENTSLVNCGNNGGYTFIGWQKAKLKMRYDQATFVRIFGSAIEVVGAGLVAVSALSAKTKPEAYPACDDRSSI